MLWRLPWSIAPCVFSLYLRSTFYSFCWPPLSSVKSELFSVPWRTCWSQPVQCQALAVPFSFCLFLFFSSAFHGASVLWSPCWIPIYKAAQWFNRVPPLCLCSSANKANWILQVSWVTEHWRWPFQWSGWWAPLHLPVYRFGHSAYSQSKIKLDFICFFWMGINLFTCNSW